MNNTNRTNIRLYFIIIWHFPVIVSVKLLVASPDMGLEGSSGSWRHHWALGHCEGWSCRAALVVTQGARAEHVSFPHHLLAITGSMLSSERHK